METKAQGNGTPLLTPSEQAVCLQIAVRESPHSQRAQALLAIADGASLAAAAEKSGLTENQVKYWVGRFRNNRLAIFPEVLIATEPAPTATPATDFVRETVAAEAILPAGKKKNKKGKKKDRKTKWEKEKKGKTKKGGKEKSKKKSKKK